MKKREYETTVDYQGEEITLIADNIYGHDMKVFMNVGNISVNDLIEVPKVMTHIYEKFQIKFREVWLGAHAEMDDDSEMRTGSL